MQAFDVSSVSVLFSTLKVREGISFGVIQNSATAPFLTFAHADLELTDASTNNF